MTANQQIICSLTLTFGVPMVVAAREYWALRCLPRGQPPGPVIVPEPPPLPDAGVRRLPECLIPRPVRELA